METTIRQVLSRHGRMSADPLSPSSVGRDTDLYESGLTSTASVNVMLALEDDLDVEFPDADLTRATFATIASIEAVLTRLTA